MRWPPWNLMEQRLEGVVVLENEQPRREAIEAAFERAGYQRIEVPAPAEVVDYRQAAAPSLEMTFVAPPRRRNSLIEPRRAPSAAMHIIRVWRADEQTLAYSIVLLPLWLLQLLGVGTGIVSVVIAVLTGEARALAGLIVAGILFGMPKLWIDDAHHVVREALGELPPVDPLVARPRGVDPLEAPEPGGEVAPSPPQRVRIATDEPALAAAAQTARDAVMRHESVDPEDAVEALERAARRGRRDD